MTSNCSIYMTLWLLPTWWQSRTDNILIIWVIIRISFRYLRTFKRTSSVWFMLLHGPGSPAKPQPSSKLTLCKLSSQAGSGQPPLTARQRTSERPIRKGSEKSFMDIVCQGLGESTLIVYQNSFFVCPFIGKNKLCAYFITYKHFN